MPPNAITDTGFSPVLADANTKAAQVMIEVSAPAGEVSALFLVADAAGS